MVFRSSSRLERRRAWPALALLGLVALAGCRTAPWRPAATPPPVAGDEIIVAGQRFHTGTRVVTWREPGGYDGQAGTLPAKPRDTALAPATAQRVRAHGWDLAALQEAVDQFVLHYDACGLSRICFETLRARQLGVHFLLDVDGTIYQTLDLRERAPHATIANDRSIGIEIANIGAYASAAAPPLTAWYRPAAGGGTELVVPAKIKHSGIRTPGFQGRPARPGPVRGVVQGQELVQYDFTPEQYAALAKLAAALCRIFPRIEPDCPRTWSGRLVAEKLSDRKYARFHGILGHCHVQANKVDPGPAFDWERFLRAVRQSEW